MFAFFEFHTDMLHHSKSVSFVYFVALFSSVREEIPLRPQHVLAIAMAMFPFLSTF